MTVTAAAETPKTGAMAIFIRRPVLAFVINTLIAVAGLAAFYGVEIRELPARPGDALAAGADDHAAVDALAIDGDPAIAIGADGMDVRFVGVKFHCRWACATVVKL